MAGMPTDPLYGEIAQRRRWKRQCWLGVVLMIAGASLLIAAFFRQSPVSALLGVGVMAIASQTPISRKQSRIKPWSDDE